MRDMKRILIASTIGVLAFQLISTAAPVEWTFPLDKTCHQGLAFADGVTGVLVWGGGDTVKLTVGRADLWDHRGGYPWTAEQSYTNIVAAAQAGDKDRLLALFKKTTPPGEPRNPYMLPLGRVTVTVPGAELKSGRLDTRTGLGTLDFERGGRTFSVLLAMSRGSHAFAMKFPEGVAFSAATTPAMATPVAGAALRKVGFENPLLIQYTDRGGFVQKLPADPSVSLEWLKTGGELEVRTFRGRTTASAEPPVGYGKVRDESVAQWKAFWDESARVEVPDAAVQDMFDYGMYRFGAMTDPDGVPAGLQGAWLEDDRLVPWNGDYHFNINVQECYSPAYRGGHFEHLKPLFRMILGWRPLLRENAKRFVGIGDGYVLPHSVDDRGVCIGGFWTGTIDHASTMWMASMMMRYVRYSGDAAFLRDGAYDFMKGAMNVTCAMLEERDGRLSLPLGPSPEWGAADVKKAVGRDPSFQLAVAHRLAADLVEAAALVGEEPDARWLDVQRRLPRYSIGPGGIQLFEGQPFVESHRHHSHMAGLYPFDIVDFGDEKARADARETYATWLGRGTGFWTGWCVPWAAILNVRMGAPEAAVGRLHDWVRYFCNDGHGSHHNAVRPGFTSWINGLGIMQMDGQCAAATAVLELFAHETNGKVEFFRGCPAAWTDVSFENLALSDGRRASGRRLNGKAEVVYSEPLGPNRGVAILMLTNETATARRPAAEWLAARNVPYHFTRRDDEHAVYAVLGADAVGRMSKTGICELLDGALLLDVPAAEAVAVRGLGEHIGWEKGRFVGVTGNKLCGTVAVVEESVRGEALTKTLKRLGYGARPASAPLDLVPGPLRTRNSEGDLIRLRDGRILFAYTRFTGGTGQDHDAADIVARESADGGRTWSSEDRVLVRNEGGQNVMEASFLRMGDGSIGLFYLRKNGDRDCRPVLRRSSDEGRTWSEPVVCVPDAQVGYYTLNNARAVRLGDGRIVLPLSLFEKGDEAGTLTCSVSDDDGRTWRRTCAPFKTFAADGTRVMTQEPGVVELKDGRLLMWARTLSGRQWACTSSDRGETWSKGEPWTLVSPLSPATVVRLRNGDLLAVWNDHESHPEIAAEKQLYGGTRRPLTLAVSKDEGRTWIHRLDLEDDPGHSRGWYCYCAALELDDALLLAYCAEQWLQRSRVVRVPLSKLYAAPDPRGPSRP